MRLQLEKPENQSTHHIVPLRGEIENALSNITSLVAELRSHKETIDNLNVAPQLAELQKTDENLKNPAETKKMLDACQKIKNAIEAQQNLMVGQPLDENANKIHRMLSKFEWLCDKIKNKKVPANSALLTEILPKFRRELLLAEQNQSLKPGDLGLFKGHVNSLNGSKNADNNRR